MSEVRVSVMYSVSLMIRIRHRRRLSSSSPQNQLVEIEKRDHGTRGIAHRESSAR